MSPLHEAVVYGSSQTVDKWIHQKDQRNFIGQTAVHFAVSKPRHLESLIAAGHEVNAADHYGITPLMYAAAMDREEAIMILIDAGAWLNAIDTRFKRTFIHYAALRGHWHLMIPILDKIKASKTQECSSEYAELVAVLFLIVYPDWRGTNYLLLNQIFSRCGSLNFTFDGLNSKNSTMLHHVKSVSDVNNLLDNGFRLIDHENTAGMNALMTVVQGSCTPDLIEQLISIGINLDHADRSGHTALSYTLKRTQNNHLPTCWQAINNVRTLVAYGASCMYRCNCRCSCSPGGCFPQSAQRFSMRRYFNSSNSPLWSMEWLNILRDQRGKEEAKSALLGFIREAKHCELELTHTCSHSVDGHPAFNNIPDDIDEILDEESELIDVLESEMIQCSEQTYEILFRHWIHQVKALLDKWCKEAAAFNARLAKETDSPQVLTFHSGDFLYEAYKRYRRYTRLTTSEIGLLPQ